LVGLDASDSQEVGIGDWSAMTTPYVHSGYARKENDDYQTVDERCVTALVDTLKTSDLWLMETSKIIDICGSHGSGIVRSLSNLGYNASAAPEAFVAHTADWIITNPPYDRAIVDKYVGHVLGHIDSGYVKHAAFLMRSNWDMAQSRADFFDNIYYHGQIRMRFRPWWSEERKAQPIHNYVWHIWSEEPQVCLYDRCERNIGPRIYYWPLSGEMGKLKTTPTE